MMRTYGRLLFAVLLLMPLSAVAADDVQVMSSRMIEDCSCVVCSDGKTTAANVPAFCGSAADANAFASEIDADKGKDGARCDVVRGKADACPVISVDAPYKGSACDMTAHDGATVIETADANGISCRFEKCSDNGCVAPGWQQVVVYKPYNQIPLSNVKVADRDRYYAFMAGMRGTMAKMPKDPPYAGPQDFCAKYPNLSQLDSKTCVGPGGRLEIDYGTSGVALLYKNGVTLPVSTDIKYRDMPDDMVRAIPYQYRTQFHGGR